MLRTTRESSPETQPVGNWTWHGAAPYTWRPTYADLGPNREVVLHIHNPIGGEEMLPRDRHLQNKKGRNAGKRSIWFNGKRRNRATGQYDEHTKPQFEK